MTILPQIEINRHNATCGTGPETPSAEEGWSSGVNALKEALNGDDIVHTEDESEAVAVRLDEWRAYYRPADVYDHWLIDESVLLTVRIDRLRIHDWVLRMLAAERAEKCWDEDRRLAAEELGARLARQPGLISGRLRRTRQGCDWLRGRWAALAALLRDGREWTEAQHTLALDLLGTPAELRDGPTRLDPPGTEGSELRAARLAVAEVEIEALVRLRDQVLLGLDEAERTSARMGLPLEPDPTLVLMMRHESACTRRMLWTLNQLRTRKRPEGVADLAPPRSARPPAPASERSEPQPKISTHSAAEAHEAAPAQRPDLKPAVSLPSLESTVLPPLTPSSGPSLRFDPTPDELPALSSAIQGDLASQFKRSASASVGNRRARRAQQSRDRRG